MRQLGLKPYLNEQAKHHVKKCDGEPWFHEFTAEGNKRGERRKSKMKLGKECYR